MLEDNKVRFDDITFDCVDYVEIDGKPGLEMLSNRLRAVKRQYDIGFCVVNGFNLGRYWNSKGPQKTLYVPAPILKQGKNEIVVLEYDAVTSAEVSFENTHDIG